MENFKVIFDLRLKESDLHVGVMSGLTWETMMPYLRQAFQCKDNEKIVALSVWEGGIKAKFEFIKNSSES